MPPTQLDIENTEFVMEFRVRARIDASDPTDCISDIDGDIICRTQTAKGEVDAKIGDVSACRIYGYRAISERYNLWDACDADSQEAADGYMLLLDARGEYHPQIEELFPDAIAPEILIIGDVHVDPPYRGRDLGLIAVRRTIDLFEPADGLVVIKPFPMQFSAASTEHPTPHPDLAMFADKEANAIAKLQRYWAKLGFRPITNTEWFGLSPANRTPTSRDLQEKLDRET